MSDEAKEKTMNEHLAACLESICHPETATNPVAWFDLEAAGLTREALRETVEAGEWLGRAPCFDKAPDRSGDMWKHLVASARSKD